jgi:hypothetical protein
MSEGEMTNFVAGLTKLIVACFLSLAVTPCIIVGFAAGVCWTGLSVGFKCSQEAFEWFTKGI